MFIVLINAVEKLFIEIFQQSYLLAERRNENYFDTTLLIHFVHNSCYFFQQQINYE